MTKVLVVDDDDSIRTSLGRVLKQCGYEVCTASDGGEALSLARSVRIDLVILDVMMPRMNGYDATRAIRASSRSYCKQVPILAMTANAFAEDVQAAKTVGMNEHLSKPLELPALARALKRWLR